MKLYKFEYVGNLKKEKLSCSEIEVQENIRVFVGNNFILNKDKVNVLLFNNTMYCLENDVNIFINALIKKQNEKIKYLKNTVKDAEKELYEIICLKTTQNL